MFGRGEAISVAFKKKEINVVWLLKRWHGRLQSDLKHEWVFNTI